MIIHTQIAGIPCQISIITLTKRIPATWGGPEDGGDFEFVVLDRNGRRAKWLERKLTKCDEERIFMEATS